MIAKGTPHNNGAKLARYMTHGKDGERAELWELRGFASSEIVDAFRSIHVIAEATKADNPFFHVQLRNPEGEILSRTQWEYAANRVERMLGLTDQPRAIAFHIDEKSGHEHMHVAWSRIDEETMTAIALPYYKERLKKLSRELELHFGLTLVPNDRDSSIKYAPTRDQEEQARRLGVNVHHVRQTIRNCFEHADCGRSFEASLAHEGLLLAQGDRRDYVVIDQGGGIHALGQRILDIPAARIRTRLSDLPREHLPTVQQAREFIAERHPTHEPRRVATMPDPYRYELSWQDALAKAAIEKERAEKRFVEKEQGRAAGKQRSPFEPPKHPGPEHPQLNRSSPEGWFPDIAAENTRDRRPDQAPANLRGAAAKIWLAYKRSPSAPSFAHALEEDGIALAAVTKEEADRSYRESVFAKEVGRAAPAYRLGEIVAVTETAQVYRINARTAGDGREEIERFLKKLDRSQLQGIDATKQAMHERAEAREAHAKLMSVVHPVVPRERIAPQPVVLQPEVGGPAPAGRNSLRVVAALKAIAPIGKTLDLVANAVESLFAPPITPEQRRENEITAEIRTAETERKLDFSRYTSEHGQMIHQQEQQRQAVHQREPETDRDR